MMPIQFMNVLVVRHIDIIMVSCLPCGSPLTQLDVNWSTNFNDWDEELEPVVLEPLRLHGKRCSQNER